jgi:hypothetical protein
MNQPELRKLMLADAARSGLTEKDIKKMQFSTTPHSLIPKTPAYTIPYFDITGKKTSFYRIRYVEDTRSGFNILAGQKPLRYSQPPKTVNEVYLPPYINWHDYINGEDPLVFTEGEKKSALATREGLPTIGLGGVWCFMSSRAGKSLLPVLERIPYKDRVVFICFDSDAATNPDIVKAESVLARRLVERGALVYICRIPQANETKVGMDDYIVKHGIDKFQHNIIESAYQFTESEVLHEFNEEVVYLRSMGMVYDHIHEMLIRPHDFLMHSHCNRFMELWEGGEVDSRSKEKEREDGGKRKLTTKMKLVKKSVARAWLEWSHRSEMTGITYAPGQPRITDSNEINMWRGWGVKDAKKGNITPWSELLDHLFDGAEPEARTWFERWCAYPIQNPGAKMATAVVMWGITQGTGKTLCGHTLMRLYGTNSTEVKDSDLEDARFTWAENKQFVLADDITGHNNRKMANLFKTMITQKTLHINKKYVPEYAIPDTINYYFTSNDPDAFFLDDADRRFFVNEVLNDALPEPLRKRYMAWIDSEAGQQALFYHLLNLPLGDFDPQAKAPTTEAKKEMTYISKSELGVFVDKLKHNPDAPLNGKMRGDLFTAEELYVVYDPMGTKRASPNALAREMKRAGIKKLTHPAGDAINVGGRRLRLYAIRNPAKWARAKPKEIAEHYAKSNPLKEAKEKF